ncbi:DUF4124 domain-containing protein [Rhodanobacter terrae]|uniref:DUF4124 domain-containing protein n=1 Tax=Rhodanobacter terrae TaxID=418647 RepID=A0ABW0SYB5_9GAMM
MMRQSAALLCLVLLAWAAPARAQTEIHRCIGANGGAVFTDQPCAALQATPVGPAATRGNGTPPATAPPPTLCAASLGALRQSVIDAFASHDANRMAGLMLWSGFGRGTVIADIRSLGELMKQPLLDVDTPDDSASGDKSPAAAIAANDMAAIAPPGTSPDSIPANAQLVLHTAGNDGSGSSRELRFDVVSRAGCLWLRNPD